MERPNVIFKWDTFSGGDYGLSRGGEKATPGTFHAKNMIVYKDGLIGPRPGLIEITPASMPTGALMALATTPVVNRNGFFTIGTSSYYFDLGNPAAAPVALTGALQQTPHIPFKPQADTATLIFANMTSDTAGDATYRADVAAGTVSKIHGGSPDTDAPGGHDVAAYGQQLLVAKSEFSPRLFGSSPTDPNDWHEGRFADVGDNWQITALHVLRNSVAILKRTGHFILTGELGDADTEVYRRVSSADGPLHPYHSAKDSDDRIWFWPLFKFGPAYFDGATIHYLGQYALPTREDDGTTPTPPLKRGVTVFDGDLTTSSILFVQGGSAQDGILNHNGIWTFHDWETDISGMMSPTNNAVVLTDGGGGGVAAKIYTTTFSQNRPSFASDGNSQPGDGSATPLDCNLTLPQQWSPDGRAVQVRQVVVDFKAWDTGVSASNHFDVTVTVLGRARQPEVSYSSTTNGSPASYDEPGSAATTAGVRKRREFNFLCAPGSGCEITLSNIRGCAIDNVYVLDGVRPAQPES